MARAEHLTGSILTGHFRVDRAYGHRRPVGSDDWLVFCVTAGRGRVTHRFGTTLLAPGDLLAYAPNTPHDYGTADEPGHWDFHWAHVHPRSHWLDWLAWPTVAPGVHHLHLPRGPVRRDVQAAFATCHRHALVGGRRGTALAQAAFETALITADAANPSAREAQRDPRVRVAMDYCARNLGSRFRLVDVAAATRLSVYRLAHLFRAETGTSIQRFVEGLRLQRAQELLIRTNLSVQEVASEVGFSSAFHFSARFRASVGSSPRAFRQRARTNY